MQIDFLMLTCPMTGSKPEPGKNVTAGQKFSGKVDGRHEGENAFAGPFEARKVEITPRSRRHAFLEEFADGFGIAPYFLEIGVPVGLPESMEIAFEFPVRSLEIGERVRHFYREKDAFKGVDGLFHVLGTGHTYSIGGG
jgi:hypothetical protein